MSVSSRAKQARPPARLKVGVTCARLRTGTAGKQLHLESGERVCDRACGELAGVRKQRRLPTTAVESAAAGGAGADCREPGGTWQSPARLPAN